MPDLPTLLSAYRRYLEAYQTYLHLRTYNFIYPCRQSALARELGLKALRQAYLTYKAAGGQLWLEVPVTVIRRQA